MSTNNRREVWDLAGIENPEEVKKVIEAFYLLHACRHFLKHFTEESDESRIHVLEKWGRVVWPRHPMLGALSEYAAVEFRRLSLEQCILAYYGFVNTEPIT